MTKPNILLSPFTPPAWLRNTHLQTCYSVFFGDKPKLPFQRERLDIPDGDFLDIDLLINDTQAPIVIACHGLEGCSRAKYMIRLMNVVRDIGWNGVGINFRGCSGEPNRLLRAYHSGDTADVDFVVNTMIQRYPNTPIFLVGYSLGANVICKWLGEQSHSVRSNIRGAASCSAPYDLLASQKIMDSGIRRIYVEYFLRSLRRKAKEKIKQYPNAFDHQRTAWSFSFKTFDDSFTAPIHGFRDDVDYYTRSSSYQYLHKIQIPTILIHAWDDPFTSAETLPTPETIYNPNLYYFYQQHGGHLGFHDKDQGSHWLPNQIINWFQQIK
jgi:predicted alpha/beta-fold hydrolase